MSKLDNLGIPLDDGAFPNGRHIVCVPRRIKGLSKRGYAPYININDERGVVGTLSKKSDMKRLAQWLALVMKEFGSSA